MPIFLLIRHGENDYVKNGCLAGRLPGVHLNKKGQDQAQSVANNLVGAPVQAVYSSPLERAMETADPISKALSLEVVPRPGLIEIDIGQWQDRKLTELNRLKLWKSIQRTPSRARFPGGETFAEAQMRICQELDSISLHHRAKDLIICVSHADPIRLAVAYYLGLPLDLFQRLYVAPASITALEIGTAESRLLTLNFNCDFSVTVPKE